MGYQRTKLLVIITKPQVGNRIRKFDYLINRTDIFKSDNRIGLTPAKQSDNRNLTAESFKRLAIHFVLLV